jgi:hypothetical protein
MTTEKQTNKNSLPGWTSFHTLLKAVESDNDYVVVQSLHCNEQMSDLTVTDPTIAVVVGNSPLGPRTG